MDKVDKLIQIVRILKEEGGMVVGAGGFTGSADPKGPVAGYDKVMGFSRRKKIIGLGSGSRKRWMNQNNK
jgi:hypothetical protein